jgi:hypothetical protein
VVAAGTAVILILDPSLQRAFRVSDVAAELEARRPDVLAAPSAQRGDRNAQQRGGLLDGEEVDLLVLIAVHGWFPFGCGSGGCLPLLTTSATGDGRRDVRSAAGVAPLPPRAFAHTRDRFVTVAGDRGWLLPLLGGQTAQLVLPDTDRRQWCRCRTRTAAIGSPE